MPQARRLCPECHRQADPAQVRYGRCPNCGEPLPAVPVLEELFPTPTPHEVYAALRCRGHSQTACARVERRLLAFDDLLAAAQTILGDVARYRERGGTLTEREEANVTALADAVAKAAVR